MSAKSLVQAETCWHENLFKLKCLVEYGSLVKIKGLTNIRTYLNLNI